MKNEENGAPVLCIIGQSVVKLELLPAASRYGVYGVVQESYRARWEADGKEKRRRGSALAYQRALMPVAVSGTQHCCGACEHTNAARHLLG